MRDIMNMNPHYRDEKKHFAILYYICLKLETLGINKIEYDYLFNIIIDAKYKYAKKYGSDLFYLDYLTWYDFGDEGYSSNHFYFENWDGYLSVADLECINETINKFRRYYIFHRLKLKYNYIYTKYLFWFYKLRKKCLYNKDN